MQNMENNMVWLKITDKKFMESLVKAFSVKFCQTVKALYNQAKTKVQKN